MKRKTRNVINAFLFVLPCLLGALVFYAIPFVINLYYSFTQNTGRVTFVGLNNYIALFQNSAFILAIKNTGCFNVLAVPLLVAVSLFFALLLNRGIKNISFFRSSLIYPLIIPSASVILVWQLLFEDKGVINGLLQRLNLETVPFLNSGWSMYIIVLLFIWKNCGYNVILFLAGLNMIPRELFEASEMEGASKFFTLRRITLPLLVPTTFFVALISIINSMKIFREVYLLTGAYPYEGLYMIQHFMNNNFENLDYGRLSTASVIVSVVIALILYFLFRQEKKSDYMQ